MCISVCVFGCVYLLYSQYDVVSVDTHAHAIIQAGTYVHTFDWPLAAETTGTQMGRGRTQFQTSTNMICSYNCLHKYAYTHTQTHTSADTQRLNAQTNTHTHTDTHTQTHTQTHTSADTQTLKMHKNTQTDTHKHTHTHIHTHTHTHKHTCMATSSCSGRNREGGRGSLTLVA